MAVPAGLAGHVEPLHGLEPGEDVLEDPGLDVVHAGHAVGGRRPLVEGPDLAGRRPVEGAIENLAVQPAPEDLVFHRGQVDRRGHGREVGSAWNA